MINKPKVNINPGSAVARKALDLCAAFGGGDKVLKDMLKEMIEIQEFNEALYVKVMEAYKGLNAGNIQLEKDRINDARVENENSKRYNDRYIKMRSGEDQLQTDMKNFSNYKKAEITTLDKEKSYCADMMKKYESGMKDCQMKMNSIYARETKMGMAEKDMLSKLDKLKGIQETFRNIVIGI